MRYLAIVAVLLIVVLTGCGSDLPPADTITVTVTPAQPSVRVGESLVLNGSVSGYSGDIYGAWYVQDSLDAEQKYCAYDIGHESSASFTECKYGYVVFDHNLKMASQARYYAPPTPGTYHVGFGVELVGPTGWNDRMSKTGTVGVVVTN